MSHVVAKEVDITKMTKIYNKTELLAQCKS